MERRRVDDGEVAPGWELHGMDGGQPYFFNVDTGESLWEHPSMRAAAQQSSFELEVPRRIVSTTEITSGRDSGRGADEGVDEPSSWDRHVT